MIEIDALNEEAQLLLGVIFGRQGQWPLAIQQLERARYLSADSALVSFYWPRPTAKMAGSIRPRGNTATHYASSMCIHQVCCSMEWR